MKLVFHLEENIRKGDNAGYSLPPPTYNVFKSLLAQGHLSLGLHGNALVNPLSHDPCFNSQPDSKISDWSKFKALADDKINVTKKLKFVLGRVENIVGKGENAGYHNVFKSFLIQRC